MISNGWTYNQFKIFRALLGTYLFVHFIHLMPYAKEVFSNAGALADKTASPLLYLFPNVFIINDSPTFIMALLFVGAIAGMAILLGKHDKIGAFTCCYLLACLLGRNPLILNPGMPYLGWLLLFYLFIPNTSGENNNRRWALPSYLYFSAFALLALTYSYSGYTKLLSPTWMSGDTLSLVLENPLARDTWLRVFLLDLPPIILKGITWGILYIELFFAPLAFFKRLRPWLWSVMLFVQFGFLVCLNFADLTFPMLLIHLITFDPSWLASKNKKKLIVFYDGICGFCHSTVRFIIQEDTHNQFQFSPIQGETIKRLDADDLGLATMVVLNDAGQMKIRSDAVIVIGWHLGGLYRIGAMLLWLLPRFLRDALYRLNARLRYFYAKTPNQLCPVLSEQDRGRFLS